MLDHAAQVQLERLVQAFYRRQRQASLLVACSVATAFVLTLGGLIVLFSIMGPAPANRENAGPKDGTSVARAARRAEIAPPALVPLVQANRAAKTASLLIPAKAGPDARPAGETAPDVQVILARPERPLALGPLLPLGSASYLLLRGLPEDAALSAGRRTGTGTWMIKDKDVAGLTLTFGANASGDYPTEAYLLGALDGPQARRRLILRIDSGPQIYAAGLGLGWSMSFPKAHDEAETVAPSTTSGAPLEAGAMNGPGNGDLTTARRLLIDRAQRGQADAAYELALTYDRDVLEQAGLPGIEGDMQIAQSWYSRAAQHGHAGAAQRLRMLARLRGGV